MPRKRKKKLLEAGRLPKPAVSARFPPGSLVRVRKGVMDPNYADIPLGGWAGIVREVDTQTQPPLCLIEWDRRTLASIHPVYQIRCDRDGLDHESMWLGEADLEPDTGEPVPLEQPGVLVPRPLDPREPEDRVRTIFQLTSDDPLPVVDVRSLHHYSQHLKTRLSFPFAALHAVEVSPFRDRIDPVLVLRLLPPEEGNEFDGLLVEVARGEEREVLPLNDLRTAEEDPVSQVLGDYAYWVENAPEDDLEYREPSAPLRPGPPFPGRGAVWTQLVEWALYAAGGGAALGAVLRTVNGADIGVKVGAVLLALVGFVVGRLMGKDVGTMNAAPSLGLVVGIFGALAGALVGGLVGALVVAFMGTILGSIAGTLVGQALAALRWKPLTSLGWTVLGGLIGAVVQACYLDQDRALFGALLGAVAAPLGVAVLLMVFIVTLSVLLGPPPPSEG